jgi:predicted MPP superfamily phosphohydrolase
MKRIIVYAPIIITLGVGFLVNGYYIAIGMLDPNFELIFDAFRFNFRYMPIAFFGLSFFYLFFKYHAAYPFIGKLKGFVICILFGASLVLLNFYITEIEPKRLKLRTIQLHSPKLTKPLRVIHFSDIQSAEISTYERDVFDAIAELDADLILFTGDFLQLEKDKDFDREWFKLKSLFDQLKPRLGIYAVYGDTELELYSKKKSELAPIEILSSNSINIDYEGGIIALHGLSLFQSKRPLWALRSIEPWLESTDETAFKILLGHAPDYAMILQDMPIDLCIAGHTHGGQVRLPFFGPLTIYSKIPKVWSLGFRKIGMPYLNVSAGVGSNRFGGLPPIRFNCPPEFTLIELLPEY